jgi:hypothetical protein
MRVVEWLADTTDASLAPIVFLPSFSLIIRDTRS